MYEHIEPKLVGNKQRVLVSDLSGQSNIRYKAKELGIDLSENKELSKKLVSYIKSLEYEGMQFDGAEASFELLLRSELNEFTPFFNVIDSKVNVMYDNQGIVGCGSSSKDRSRRRNRAYGIGRDGPVNALDNALRKALLRFYPDISLLKLIDYKVRVLDKKKAPARK